LVNSKVNPQKFYKIKYKIGEGAVGDVYLAKCIKGKEKVAIKEIELSEKNIDSITAEIAIMLLNDHPNLVKYINSYIFKKNSGLLWNIWEADALPIFSFNTILA